MSLLYIFPSAQDCAEDNDDHEEHHDHYDHDDHDVNVDIYGNEHHKAY